MRRTSVGVGLGALEVLVVDCQTTGANPKRGSLLEIAWSRLRAVDAAPAEVTSHLARLPRGRKIPHRVAQLTGIRDEDMVDALPPHAVWRRLRAAFPAGLAVAHFARFERTFLSALHEKHAPGAPFPLDLLCTHEIVCRLLPGLPRRGLRAVAGYFGHVMDEPKRAGAHVEATAVVWRALVERLAAEGVETLPELQAWLDAVAPVRRAGRDFPVARESRLALPDAPGVYRMLGRGGQVLYLGKATSLKRRVNSYFQHRRHGGERKREMLTQTFRVDVSVTATPLEAALAEADEIKRHAPLYNVALREKQPEVWFAARDLEDVATTPDAAHPLGPLPRADALEPLAALRRLPARDRATWMRALGWPEGTARLDPACLRAGFDLFRAAHGSRFDLFRLLRIGARVRRREEDDEPPERDTPEGVARALESAVRRSTHLLRRARWLRRLCDSRLVWRPAGRDRRRVLVMEAGRVAYCADGVSPAPAPARRRACFDAATYDRLRVLTTELRRVVVEADEVELSFGPHVRLDRARLARRLEWV